MIIGTYKERKPALLGAQLLALSLEKHCPDLRLVIFVPEVRLDEFSDFLNWSKRLSNVEIRPWTCPSSWMGYNAKPFVLKTLLQESDKACWIDTDIIVNRDFRVLLQHVSWDTLVVAEESSWVKNKSSSAKTEAWGMQPGKLIDGVVCSCFIQVHKAHLHLLDDWQNMLNHPSYLEAQKLSPRDRANHLHDDQNLLTALLGSKKFEHLPLKWIRRGFDIVQETPGLGYSAKDRIINFLSRRAPPLLHAQAECKPWVQHYHDWKQRPEAVLLRTNVELSAYFSEAIKYKHMLDKPMPCLEFRSSLARFLRFITFGNPDLQGLPLTVLYAAAKKTKTMLR
jgi:hypothetical protein